MSRRIVRNGRSSVRMLETLESRVLMTAVPTTAATAGEWYLAGMDVGGSLTVDGTGAVTAGSLTFGSGAVVAGNGDFTVGAGGAFTLDTNEFTSTGAVNSTVDVFSVTNTTDDFPFIVAVKHTGVFGNANVAGTWNFYTNGNDGGSTGSGKLILDDLGNIKVGSTYKSTLGTKPVTGTYTIDVDGNMTLVVTVTGAGTFSFGGAMNDSKNVAALGADDLADAVANDNSRMAVLVKKGAGFKLADMKGTWKMAEASGSGDVTFDGKGKFTGTLTAAAGPVTVTGTYSISAVGLVTLKVKAIVNPGVSQTVFNYTLTAAINQDRNEVVSVQTPTLVGSLLSLNSMTTFTRADNYAPTLTMVQPISKAVQGVPFDISFAQLALKANEADQDASDVLGFVISSVDNTKGTLEVNGAPVVEDVTTVFAGDTITWTPDAAVIGSVLGFTVRATDGDDVSAADIGVKVTTVKKPVLSVGKSGLPNELTGKTGIFTISRAGGDISTPLDVTYTMNTLVTPNDGSIYTTVTGTATIPAGKPSVQVVITPVDDGEGSAGHTVKLTLAGGSTYTLTPTAAKQSATLVITDPNRAPELQPFTDVSGNVNTPLPMNYALLLGHTQAQDPEGSSVKFKIKNINGTLFVDGAKVTGSVTVQAGQTLSWTPKLNVNGTVRMFDIAAFDGTLTSAYEAANAVVS